MQTIQWFKPQGYMTLSNSHGMEIMIDNTYEEVAYRYSGDQKVHSSQIECDIEGEAFFSVNSTSYYLNQFIKI
jgi:hypothetical protein